MLSMLAVCVLGCKNTESNNNQDEVITDTSTPIVISDSNALQLTYSMPGEEDKIPSPWSNNRFFTNQMYRCIFLANSTFDDVENDLAESYTVSDDGFTYEITLKDDIKWSDGEDLTINDVVFSIETVLVSGVANGIYTTAFSKISGYDEYIIDRENGLSGLTVDGNTLTIKLDYAHPMLLQVLAQFVILPEHILCDVNPLELRNSEYWVNPVVSGAYKVAEIVPSEYFKLELNEFYSETMPKIEEIMIYITAESTQYALDGKIDYYVSNIPTEINYFKEFKGMETTMVDLLFYRYFIVNVEGVDGNVNEAMQDADVRKAILYAIDRETLIHGIYPDLGMTLNSGVPDFFAQSNGVTFDYDPDYAKELLAQSDYDISRPLRLAYYYVDQTSVDFMNAVAGYRV